MARLAVVHRFQTDHVPFMVDTRTKLEVESYFLMRGRCFFTSNYIGERLIGYMEHKENTYAAHFRS